MNNPIFKYKALSLNLNKISIVTKNGSDLDIISEGKVFSIDMHDYKDVEEAFELLTNAWEKWLENKKYLK